MKLSTILAPMLAAGVPSDVIMQTILAFEAEQASSTEAGKEKARERWRRWKAGQPTNVGKRLQQFATHSHADDAPVEAKTLNLEDEQEGKKGRKSAQGASSSSDIDDFQAALAGVLDAELIATIVQSRRQKKGAAVNGNTGRLLSKALSRCPDARAAAEEMVVRGWTTVKPDWLSGGNGRAPPGQNQPETKSDVIRNLRQQLANGQSADRRDPGPDGSYGQLVPFAGRSG